MDRIDELGVEPASSVLHCPRSIMEFKQTRGQDGFCGRYQGSNESKRAKRLTMSLAPTLPTPYTPSYAHCPPFVLLYTQVHKDVTVSWYMLSNVSDSRLWLLKSNVVGWHKHSEQYEGFFCLKRRQCFSEPIQLNVSHMFSPVDEWVIPPNFSILTDKQRF